MQRLLFVALIAVASASAQGIKTAIENYNKLIDACTTAQCREEDGAEQAAKIIQLLTTQSSRGLLSPAGEDTNEGRRIALRLLPDRLLGATSGAGGGTALASLPGVTELISAAMESGAFQRSTAGTVSTFRANVVGATRLLSGDCPKGSLQAYPACIAEDRSGWRGLSVLLSFDTARSDQPAPSAATLSNPVAAVLLRGRNGLAAAGIRYEFFRPANQATQRAKVDWKNGVEGLRTTGGKYGEALAGPAELIVKLLAAGLPAELNARLLKTDPAKRQAVAEQFFAERILPEKLTVSQQAWSDFQGARAAYLAQQVKFYKETLDRRLFTVEFTHQRPKDEPEYANVKFVLGHTAGTHQEKVSLNDREVAVDVPNWNITFNLGFDFFWDKKQVQKDRSLRDFHVALQADRKLWKWRFLGQPTFTLAGYYQRLTDDAVLSFNSDAIVPGTGIPLPKPANVILKGTKGDVGIAQARLSIPLKDSGVSVPLAVSWSNRTELLRLPGNNVRGHFGLLFDMDKLITSLQGKAR